MRERPRRQKIHHGGATSSRSSARNGFPRRSRRRRWTFIARCVPSIRRRICFCWSWTDFRSSARRRKSMCAARKARLRSAPIAGTRPRGKKFRRRFRARKRTARRPEGTRRTRHARGPRAQRHRARLRFRFGAGERFDDRRAIQPRHAHRVAGRGENCPPARRFTT